MGFEVMTHISKFGTLLLTLSLLYVLRLRDFGPILFNFFSLSLVVIGVKVFAMYNSTFSK